MVGVDGEVTLPLIDPVKVAGLDLQAAQALVKQELSRKLYRQQGPDGRESVTAISPDAVMLSIAEYKPVYLNGDVTKPGEQPYRPGMTVRQAVALAGGYEIMRFRMTNPFLESADLRNEYQTLWMGYVRQQARIWRLQAQLQAGNPSADSQLSKMTQAPLPETFLQTIRGNARQQLDAAQDRLQAQHAFLQKAVDMTDHQIDLLRDRQVKDDDNATVDKTEYEKLKDFAAHGNLPSTRLAESRRMFLLSATQSLQTSVQLADTIRERAEAQRKIGDLDERTRAALLKEIEDATLDLDGIRSRLQAVSEKITYTGMIRSQLKRGTGSGPTIHITHSAASGGGSETAGEDTPVRPGDTIDVALHVESPATEE
jgi:polysaccharide export outer membrane protein